VDVAGLRLAMAAFFGAMSVWAFLSRGCMGSACGMVPRVARDAEAQARLHEVLLRRSCLEAMPAAAGVAVATGDAALAVLALATTISLALLYAACTVLLAVGLFAGYLRLRHLGGRRVAALQARTPFDVVPPYAYAIALAVAFAPFVALRVAPLAAVVVTLASLAILAIAWQVASLPALITGDDVPVERFADARIREVRTTNLIGVAAAPVFVFLVFTQGGTAAQTTIAVATFAVVLATVVRQSVLVCRPPDAAELARWRALHA